MINSSVKVSIDEEASVNMGNSFEPIATAYMDFMLIFSEDYNHVRFTILKMGNDISRYDQQYILWEKFLVQSALREQI